MFGWIRKRRRRKWIAQEWPEDWGLILNRNVRLTWYLSDSERARLHDLIKIFVNEKHWEGCDGVVINDEIKVTVAAQACLMLLGVDDFYFENVKSILIFPQAFSRETSDGLTRQDSHRAGEAWQGGPIILSWQDTLRGGRNQDDGRNLVIHEFAHALDGLDGEMGGNLMFSNPADSREWKSVVEHEFHDLVHAKNHGRWTLLDHYGATNRAEFFAVAAETFFELPDEMFQQHRRLFGLLSTYFCVDPRGWQRQTSGW